MAVATNGESGPRKRGTRAETRQRLVEAAVVLIQEHGAPALTTVSVTRAAGLAQSGFYLHFRDIDECKRAAAEDVAEFVREFVSELYRRPDRRMPADLAELEGYFVAVLELFTGHGHLPELVIRCRHDTSAMGDVIRQLLDDLRTDLATDITARLAARELTVDVMRVAAYAEMIVGLVLVAGEALIDGRQASPMVLAHELALATAGMVLGML